MKRSEINFEIREAEKFFASFQFKLPKFAYWTPEEMKARRHDPKYREIFDCNLGWDLTDFGKGDFRKEGLFLFTVRNGIQDSELYPKPYAEKIMISRSNQLTLTHCHEFKREDIINRGGGRLVFELFNRKGNSAELEDTPVRVSRDGEELIIPAGEKLILEPGESILLERNVFHRFYAEEGADVLIGEVSAVNDDHNDNVFYGKQLRFPEIIEDEAPYRYLVSDYCNL
ncbi:MAG: D-lyxose/D-mannose family sugar isomerase [Lentisphaerae bacterium]|nr:D-lyxose/D-mannose family sugar isomerase [Lentisphaerota bacterium]MBR2720867.1 D-lyxose/D-mannose family sugar isomerase [Lentisphaeria bacterium]